MVSFLPAAVSRDDREAQEGMLKAERLSSP